MKTTVVNIRSDNYDIYIGRGEGCKWGNKFVIGQDGDRLEVIAKYRTWILGQPQLLADLHELRGLRLGCWCAPAICHGNILAELADIPIGPAIWKSKNYDMPVDITGIMGLGDDGKIYLRDVFGTGLPLDEVVGLE